MRVIESEITLTDIYVLCCMYIRQTSQSILDQNLWMPFPLNGCAILKHSQARQKNGNQQQTVIWSNSTNKYKHL